MSGRLLRLGQTTENELHLGISVTRAAILMLPIALTACAGGDEGRSIAYTDDRGVAMKPVFEEAMRQHHTFFTRTRRAAQREMRARQIPEVFGHTRDPRLNDLAAHVDRLGVRMSRCGWSLAVPNHGRFSMV